LRKVQSQNKVGERWWEVNYWGVKMATISSSVVIDGGRWDRVWHKLILNIDRPDTQCQVCEGRREMI
jgi:hypothetical protein